MKIVEHPAAAEPRQDIINRLNFLLARAKRGEIKALAYTYVDDEEAPVDGWVYSELAPARFGHVLGSAISALFHRFYAESQGLAVKVPNSPDEPA